MRLCLDEHYSSAIARELRRRGHDVFSVTERPELVGRSDRELLAAMRDERRALLTENVADFAPVVRTLVASGEDHWGVVFSSPRSLPRGAATIGLFAEALDRLLSERRAEDALKDQIWWLQPPPR